MRRDQQNGIGTLSLEEWRDVAARARVGMEARVAAHCASADTRAAVGYASIEGRHRFGPISREDLVRHMDSLVAALSGDTLVPVGWHGLDALVFLLDDGSASAAAERARAVHRAAAANLVGSTLWCGVAHISEAGDPWDLLRLAALRSHLGRRHARPIVADGQLTLCSVEIDLSAGERSRLQRIAEARSRSVDAVLREAIGVLVHDYR